MSDNTPIYDDVELPTDSDEEIKAVADAMEAAQGDLFAGGLWCEQ